MTDPGITDDQIRIELKRMLAAEQQRLESDLDRIEQDFAANPDIPADRREQIVAEFSAKMQEGRERLERTMQTFADFIDRRDHAGD